MGRAEGRSDGPTGLGSRRARISDTLVAAIGAKRLEPGATYSAADLAAQLDVRVSAVNEAMIDLAVEGLVEPVGDSDFQINAPTVTELREMIELRLLVEVPAARKVTDEGISDAEIATLKRLAETTMSAALENDILGYINADMAFHLYLLGLGGNQQVVEIVRVLRSRSRLHGLRDEETPRFMLDMARQHLDLLGFLTEGRISAVDELLRRHLSGITASWPTG